jgi:BlaI family transcriptional regulator, penicillinase repressor
VLAPLESDVMEELWERGERTVREVLDALNARRSPQRAYTTVLTVMQRLHDKGLLRRESRGRLHVYVPALSRDEYAEAQVGALVDEYGDVALAHFARAVSRLDPKRREQILRLADDD